MKLSMLSLWRVPSTSLQNLMILPFTVLLELCRTTQPSSLISQSVFNGNSLSLQPTKCCAMVILRKRSNTDVLPPLFVEGIPLPNVSSMKYLRVLITSNLSWSEHVAALNSKTRRLICALYRNFYPIQHNDQALCSKH